MNDRTRTSIHIIAFLFLILPNHALSQASDSIALSMGDGHEKLAWFSAPNYRGTLDILWTCLFTIFLCCWTAIHHDIAPPGSSWKQTYLDRTACLLIGTIAPEIFIYIAFCELMDAKHIWKGLPPHIHKANDNERKSKYANDNWTTSHKYYTSMGGFCLVRRSRKGDSQDDFQAPIGTDIDTEILGYLAPKAMYQLLYSKRIGLQALPSADDICDKGKADGVIKAFALLQIVWVLIQSIARAIQHLPLTTLEITTLAYIPCAVFLFYLWWDKPYDVSVPTMLDVSAFVSATSFWNQLSWQEVVSNDHNSSQNHRPEGERHPITITRYQTYRMTRECWAALRSTLAPINRLGLLSSSVLLIVGGIHLAAWNFSFPSTYEMWAWRAASLTITLSIPLSWLLTRICSSILETGFRALGGVDTVPDDNFWLGVGRGENGKTVCEERMAVVFQGFGVGLYALARLYLLGEVFASLRAVPKGVYETPDWTMFIPHVS